MNQDNNKNNQNQNRNRLNIPSNFHNYQKMLSNNKLSNFSKKSHSIRHASQSPSSRVSNDELTQEQLEEQAKQTSSQNKTIIPPIAPKPEPVKGAVEFVKTAAKKKLLALLAPAIVQISLIFVGALLVFLIFMTPVARLTQAGENVNGWWADLKNTFTSFCFFCSDEERAASEQAKREEKFYEKINKIKNAYLQGKGMDGGDGDDDFSIELDLALLVSSILYNEDLYAENVAAMQDTIDSDSYPSYKKDEFNNLTEEEFDTWKTNNKNYLIDIGLGPNSTFQSVKDELSKTQQEMEEMDISLGWYVAKGDPIGVEWYSEKAAPGAKCYVEEYIYSQDEDPAWASTARRIAKHMVERKINATCTLRSHTDERGNTRYYWEKRVEFDYVLNVEEEQKLYTPEVHANPYPARRTPDELNDPRHPNPYVKYMLSTYIPSKYENLIKDEELVPTEEYITSLKIVLAHIYTYRDTYEQWLKYWEDESSSMIAGNGSCTYNFVTDDTKKTINTSNVKVRLLECNEPYEPMKGEELVDFEKYILGVVYAENGAGPKEALKAQAIAARNFALKGAADGASNHYFSENQTILNISNCTGRQVYCDPDKGCSSSDGFNKDIHSGHIEGLEPRPAVTEKVRSAVAEVTGEVLVNSKGEIIGTDYKAGDGQIQWNDIANQGKDYNEILTYWYSQEKNYDASKIVKATCQSGFIAGDWSSWKQGGGSPWAGIQLVNGKPGTTIAKIGCAATSVAMLIAGSGTKVTIPDFNPGTFVQELKKAGGFTSGGAIRWGKVSTVAPNFIYDHDLYFTGKPWETKIDIIKSYLDKGHFIVLGVNDAHDNKGPGHYVAIDRIEGNTIYTFDPAVGKLGIIGQNQTDYTLSSVTRIVLYHKTD